EKDTLESHQEIRDLKKQIDLIKKNVQEIKINTEQKQRDIIDQNYKLSLLQNQLSATEDKKESMKKFLKTLESECLALAK
uniref:TACC_C domain-containing protein n=1 Tax=Mesocestoides corti TaxID=53468 RepID=A0A5K3EX14_MESCO